MINKITVSERRGLFPQYSNLGTIGEKNATTLLFLLPLSLQGYDKNIVCVTSQGSFNYTVSNDTFDLPSEVLTDNALKLQLVLKDGDRVVWKSIPYTFTLFPTLDFGKNIFTELVEAASKLFGEDLTGATIGDIIKRIAAAKLLNAGEVTVDGVYGSDTVINPPEGKNAISKVTVKAFRGEELVVDKVFQQDRTYTPTSGKIAFTKVTQKALEPRDLNIYMNGNYGGDILVDPDAEADYYTHVFAAVRPLLYGITVNPEITDRTYTIADSGYIGDGLDEVTVKAVTAAIDSNIKPENIVDGVTILGVAGSAVVGDTEELTYLLSRLENIFEQEAVV